MLMQKKPIEIRKLQWRAGRGLPYCHKCGEYATSEALFDAGTYIMVQKYCEKCLLAAKFDN
jgi:MinD superfamily P-loop ATPase